MSAIDPTVVLRVEARVRRHRRRPPISVLVAMLVVVVVVVCAIAGAQLAPHDPMLQDLTQVAQPPGHGHLLGTDQLGRDVLSRMMAGARTAVVGPLIIALGAASIGSLFGLLAGYRGGRADATIMRLIDLMYSLPALLVVIVIAGVLGGGYVLAVALLTVFTAPGDTRLIRAATLEQRPRPYVEAAETLGLSGRRVMLRHIWPNVLPVIVANSFLVFGFSVVGLAGLSFVGIGVDPLTPDWGLMLNDGRTLIFQNAWVAIGPAAMIMLTVLSVNLIGDWAFGALSDRGRRR